MSDIFATKTDNIQRIQILTECLPDITQAVKDILTYFFVVGCFFMITAVPLTLAICLGIVRWLT